MGINGQTRGQRIIAERRARIEVEMVLFGIGYALIVVVMVVEAIWKWF